jgi:hypothetical protein
LTRAIIALASSTQITLAYLASLLPLRILVLLPQELLRGDAKIGELSAQCRDPGNACRASVDGAAFSAGS